MASPPSSAPGLSPSAASPHPSAGGEGRRPGPSVIAACLAVFCAYVPQTAVSTALPTIQADLGVSTGALTWVLDAFVLAMAAFIMPSGTLGERYGHKKVLVGGLSLHAVPDPRRRAQAIAAWASALAIGLVAGPYLSTLVIDTAGVRWLWIFAAMVPMAAVGLLFACVGVQETRRRSDASLDIPGQVTAVLMVAALVFAVIEGPTAGWGSARVVTGFAVALLGTAGFLLRESRAASPMLDLRLFRIRPFSATGVVAVLLMFGLIGTQFLLSLFFGGVQHAGMGDIALRFLVINAGVVICGPIAGRMARRLHPRVPLITGLALAGAGMLSLTGLSTTSSLAYLWWRLAAIGSGFGLVLASMTTIAVGSVPPALMGMAGAATNTVRQIGGALGPAVLGAIVTSRIAATLPGELTARHVDPSTADRARELLDRGGLHALGELPPGPRHGAVIDAAGHAFTDGVHVAVVISGLSLLAAALLSLIALRPVHVAPRAVPVPPGGTSAPGTSAPDVPTLPRRSS